MTMAENILNGVTYWLTRRERADSRDDAAIRSVLSAVNRTKSYLAQRRDGRPEDLDAERALVELWEAAAVHVRRTDADLAERLQEKAEYWAAPRHWAAGEEAERRIQIDEIAKEARRLLKDV